MSDQLLVMQKVAKEAGAIQIASLEKAHEITYKGSIDLVTEVDRACEDLIVAEFAKHFPETDILAEEGSGLRTQSKGRFIIDPLDGTINYTHRFPFFGVSIAYEENGELQAGVIYDPNRDELFSAQKGKGAQLNGKPIHVSDAPRVKEALVATGFAYHNYSGDPAEEVCNFNHFANFIRRARGVRRPGSAAIDLAWVSCGRVDGFWEWALKPWDMAAGAIIVREAGALVTRFDGSPFDTYGDQILVANRKLHQEMIEVLQLP